MKPSKASGFFKPFKNLDALLEDKDIKLKPAAPPTTKEEMPGQQLDARQEQDLFKAAMTGVEKISRSNCPFACPPDFKTPAPEPNPESEAVQELKNLVRNGDGFVVSLTPEYIEGSDNMVNPAIAQRLHRGDFSIQDHVDLHGLSVEAARETFDKFFQTSIAAGKNAVLVIHGRGLSSPGKPVLKSKVYQWLTTSPWRKWVVAFTSARMCDGGAGATYVLFRQRPLAKRYRKMPKKA
ncbi:MAG: Smr/MutS family protein [Deltaproteobacteria bacterium]|jgi:DNA-nicking Smr family endonuclease|nr:Smr/MutS family protein [Deltaproteobacteria bacterium]